jgi:2'-5' RNA ligase
VFPVPAAIGVEVLREHVRSTVARTPAFTIRLKGIGKTWDHWLFLAVAEGRDRVIELHDALYTGVLREHRWTGHRYEPHVGLGHFAQPQDVRDPLALRPRALDRSRYVAARREAEALDLDYSGRFESVHLFGLDEPLTHVTRLEEIPLG